MHSRLLSLVKPRIVALLSLTGLSALFAAGGTGVVALLGFAAAGVLVAGGSAALNCWYDRDIDRRMERTSDRPLPSGDLHPDAALAFAAALLAAGSAVGLATLPVVAVGYMWLGVAAYVGLYTVLLKRRTRLGVVLGGSAGAFPVLAGWTAVRPLAPEALALAGLVFAWTPAHAWALAYVYRDDFAAVDVPTLPAVSTPEQTARAVWYAALGTVAVAAGIAPLAGLPYAAAAAAGTPLFLAAYWKYYRTRTEPAAVWAFFASNCYLAVLFLAWAVGGASTSPLAAAATAGLAVAAFAWLRVRRPSLRGVTPDPPRYAALARAGRPGCWLPANVFAAIASGVAAVRDSVNRHVKTHD